MTFIVRQGHFHFYHKMDVMLLIKEDVTLTEDEGHRLRPNVIKIGHISQTITLKFNLI